MNTYTVIAVYSEPVSLYCETVDAHDPDAAIDAAWEACRVSNWGVDADVALDDEWSAVMVIAGGVEVVA